MIDGHGDDLFLYGNRIEVNFSTNIPQSADHAGLLAHLAGCGALFRNYPEPEPRSIEELLAGIHGIPAANVIVTAGATEAIYLLAQVYAHAASTVLVPTFREYQDACRLFGHSVRFSVSLDEVDGRTKTVWLCNPDNPTGRVRDRLALLRAADRFPETLFIVDQASAAYAAKAVLRIEDAVARPNVMLLCSLTKRFCVPGLRIGYAVGSASLIRRMRACRMPWSVNAVAVEAARYLLARADDYPVDAAGLHSEAVRMVSLLSEIGFAAEPTDCHFFLAAMPDRTASELKEWLVGRHGLLIRDASNFEGLTPRHFRVAAQRPQENDLLINALKEWNLH